MYMRTTQAGDV